MSSYGRTSPKSQKKAESPGLNVPIVVGVCVVLVIFLGLLGYHYFGSSTSGHLPPHPAGPDESWMLRKAMESKGDFGKLSPADQQEAFKHGGGEAPYSLKMMYMSHKGTQPQ